MTDENPPSPDRFQPGQINLENAFWQFSLMVYGEEEVRNAALDLQDTQGADVNLLLLSCWLGFMGIRLDDAAFKRLDTLVSPWRNEVIQATRALRSRLKGPIGPVGPDLSNEIRATVQSVEIQMEQVEQAILFRALETLPGTDARQAERSGVARLNLRCYLETTLDVSVKDRVRDQVESLIHGARRSVEKREDQEQENTAPDDA